MIEGLLTKNSESLEKKIIEKQEEVIRELEKTELVKCPLDKKPKIELLKTPQENNRLDNIRFIYDYNYAPKKMNFLRGKDDYSNMFLGCEIEAYGLGENKTYARMAQMIMGDDVVYCEHDGSLDGNGFEVITHPCTLKKHYENNYDGMFKYLKSKGANDDNEKAGLHIHLNRSFFGNNKDEQDMCIAKIIMLIESKWGYISRIARRGDVGYSKRLGDGSGNQSFLNLYLKSKDIGKYACVNIQHKNTIEFRMFKGTLSRNVLLASLELISNLATIVIDKDIKDMDKITFRQIVNCNEAPFLKEFLQNRKVQY